MKNWKRIISYIDIPSPVNATLHFAPTDANTDLNRIFTLKVKSSHKILHLEYRQHSAGNTSKLSDLNNDFKFFLSYNFVHLQKIPEDHDLTTVSREIQFYIL